MKKRLLSALLAVCMVMTMAPAAFAADNDTLQAKIDADTSGTIQLERDYTENITISEGKNITLDLNGNTISSEKTTILNNGTLVIEDTKGNGSVTSSTNVAVGVGNDSKTTFCLASFRVGRVLSSRALRLALPSRLTMVSLKQPITL